MITFSKNKKVITIELFFSSPQILNHAPNSTQESSDNCVRRGHQTSDRTDDMLKLFTQMDFINRVDLTASTYKTSYCAKLSQKEFVQIDLKLC